MSAVNEDRIVEISGKMAELSLKRITELETYLVALETKIRKAYLNTDNLPSFLKKPREKPIEDIIEILAYHEDQYWNIVGILANYPTLQKTDEHLSDAIERLVDLFDTAEKESEELLRKAQEIEFKNNVMARALKVIKNDIVCTLRDQELSLYLGIADEALSTSQSENGELTAVVEVAKLHIGAPFIWGGNTPTGFDCSGFTQYIMKENGITIPRTAAEQYQHGISVLKADLRLGDILFFTTYKAGATHVGIYIGEDKFIHASQIPEPGQVTISLMTEPYYTKRYIGARRYIKICSGTGQTQLYTIDQIKRYASYWLKRVSCGDMVDGEPVNERLQAFIHYIDKDDDRDNIECFLKRDASKDRNPGEIYSG